MTAAEAKVLAILIPATIAIWSYAIGSMVGLWGR